MIRHTSAPAVRSLELCGQRVRLVTLVESDYEAWYEVRDRCRDWLVPWEPRSKGAPLAPEDAASFAARCGMRERERQLGSGFGFGIFFEGRFTGEVTLSSIQRGPFQNGSIGYWIDEDCAGQGLIPEAVVVVLEIRLRDAQAASDRGRHHPPQPAQPAGGGEAGHALRGRGARIPGDQRRMGGPRPLRHDRRGMGHPAPPPGSPVDRGRLTSPTDPGRPVPRDRPPGSHPGRRDLHLTLRRSFPRPKCRIRCRQVIRATTGGQVVTAAGKKRIGVLVVAYNAATTLAKVLDRIPAEIRSDIEEVIVSDDHSQDSTYLVGLGYQQVSDLPITLIRQPTNLGYGGNQKAGYDLAIEHGLDIVVMLHGDGQYAPESLPEIVAPLLAGEADAVFGSRMMIKGAARRGGMPLYKYVGNRILSRFENAALGTELTEFHSGYRAYSVAALKQLPFERNSNGFNFDTQIIIQLHDAGHAHRRGADPHLLRRRDLLRRRYGLRRRRHQGRGCLPAPEGRLRGREPHRPQRGVPTQAQRGQLARPHLHAAQVPTAGQGPRPGVLERAAVGAAPGHGPPRHRRRPQRDRRGARTGPTPSSGPTSTRASPPRWGPGSTSSWPPTCSSTW